MAEDPDNGHLLLFGGMADNNQVLNDCWFLLLTQDVDPSGEYEWGSCSPTSPTALAPMERYGAGAVYHASSKSFYVYGGFAWTSTSFRAANDMWVLRDYQDVSKVEWTQVHSVSEQPTGRG